MHIRQNRFLFLFYLIQEKDQDMRQTWDLYFMLILVDEMKIIIERCIVQSTNIVYITEAEVKGSGKSSFFLW